jgi:hypothetical protein
LAHNIGSNTHDIVLRRPISGMRFAFIGAKTLAAPKPDTKQVQRLVLFGIKTRWNNSNKALMRSSS